MPFPRKIMLITYADSMGRNLKELRYLLKTHFQGAIGGLHILPFFPSSADRGFAPITYKKVDERFGTWEDIEELGKEYYLMFDFMINHISRQSAFFQDFLARKDASPYASMFIRYKDIWPQGEPPREELDMVYKRKPRPPYVTVRFADGSEEKIWCTFSDEQIDLNVTSAVTQEFIAETLKYLAQKGASLIRLDAVAYTIKKRGTNCFFVEPEIWKLLDFCRTILAPYGVEVLPEVHEHYSFQLKLAERGYWVYDFALPMLVLHTLYSGSKERLLHWLRICPKKQFTTLDTHDGIGVVDAKDLLTDEEIEKTEDYLYSRGANVKRIYSTTAYNNLDIYQINCTYYSALGNNDDAYLLARAIQFFSPGIPQVYYVGLLAGENDVELVERTKQGRDINRHCYTVEEVEENLKRPVVQKLLQLMRFRNNCPAFDGNCVIQETDEKHLLILQWIKGEHKATLKADLKRLEFEVTYCNSLRGKEEEVL
ncbi:MAG: sucrose phosphorylase [Candidatus Caldatribacterium sp.]|uniref:sucrose phosphorylase n=1 Tax=Candidatus Caldatribacterium sp. TaxID=2282143 RepID=UPI00299B244B|nr:sucrose phosphorylase [Candidatus Caldatribacterium sp.]MCX7729770.1 sucrose phosphorylase [Candidatus Caldatribacterium sp.]MDW8081906.1 sucrose phosphorylase [Candidatus Calescibacterium sp.]